MDASEADDEVDIDPLTFDFSTDREELVSALKEYFSLTRDEHLWSSRRDVAIEASTRVVSAIKCLLLHCRCVIALAEKNEQAGYAYVGLEDEYGNERPLRFGTGRHSPTHSILSGVSSTSTSSIATTARGHGAVEFKSEHGRLLTSAESFLMLAKYAMAGHDNKTEIVACLAKIARSGKRLFEMTKSIIAESRDFEIV